MDWYWAGAMTLNTFSAGLNYYFARNNGNTLNWVCMGVSLGAVMFLLGVKILTLLTS
jgi:hypothetical protein